MGFGSHYPTKASGKDAKSDSFFQNKGSLIFLALTVLSLQVADFALVWLADAGSKSVSASDYWSLSNNWTQVDIFVGVFALFYIGKRFTKKPKDSSCTPTAVEKPKQRETASVTKWQTKGPRPERRVSFSQDVDTVEPMQKTSALRADAPAFVSGLNQGLRAEAPVFKPKATDDQGLRAEAPIFTPKAQPQGLSAEAPLFMPKAQVVPPPPPPLPEAFKAPADMDEDVGTVLFRSACSAESEQHKLKPKKAKEPKQDYDLWQSQANDPWAKQSKDQAWASPEAKSKWQPKEKTIWKSSHVLGA